LFFTTPLILSKPDWLNGSFDFETLFSDFQEWLNGSGLSLPLESGQLERWYFHLGASNGFSVLLVPTLSLLKYFDITLPRHKSSKVEGTGPPLMSYSIQFHCFCFHFSTVSKRETVYTRWYMKGVHVPSHLQSCRCLTWFWEKIRKKSQKIGLNRIIWQRIFRFLKFEFFGSILEMLN